MSDIKLKVSPLFPLSKAGQGIRLDKNQGVYKFSLDASQLVVESPWIPQPGDSVAMWDGASYFRVSLPVLLLAPDPPTVYDNASIGTAVGGLSVFGGIGTYTFTLLNDAGGKYSISGHVLQVAAPLTIGIDAISIQADNGAGNVLQLDTVVAVLHFVGPPPLILAGFNTLDFWFNGVPQPGITPRTTTPNAMQFWFNGQPLNTVFK